MTFHAPAWWWDGCKNTPPCPHHDMNHIDDPIPWCIVDGCSCGMPSFYEAPQLALPWGDSAYTTFTPCTWLPGDPPPDPGCGWYMGPPDNGLTPSSEGPRREHQAAWRAFARYLDGRPYHYRQDFLSVWDHADTSAGHITATLPADEEGSDA